MAKRGKSSDTSDTKKKLLDALKKSLGIVTEACNAVKVSRQTFYRYCDEDPEFKAAVEAMEDIALDFVEGALYKQVKKGIPSSTIFYLKTRGRKRGYIERTEHTGADGQPLIPAKITVEIIGQAPPITREEDIQDI